MSKLQKDVNSAMRTVTIHQIEQALWENELITWSGDELMTEEINDVFINAAMEN